VFGYEALRPGQREAIEAALAQSDLAVVLDVYPAREQPDDYPGVTGKLVANAAADAGGRVAWLPRHELAEAFLRRELREGDLLLTLGAGDVDRVGRALVD
jgi:UDP-N-acetylmuramate--alanine ligase